VGMVDNSIDVYFPYRSIPLYCHRFYFSGGDENCTKTVYSALTIFCCVSSREHQSL